MSARAKADAATARTPLELIAPSGGLATWGAGARPDGRPGVYALAGDGGRLPVWSALEPATMRDAIAWAGAMNRRVALAVGARP